MENILVSTIEDKDIWNELLLKCENVNIFSTWEWGEYKKSSKNIDRLAFFKNDEFIGLTQIAYKKVLSYRIGWASGGVHFIQSKYLKPILFSLKNHYNFSKTIIRFNFFDKSIGFLNFSIDEISSLHTPTFYINSSYTIRHYKPNSEGLALDKNTRYYLKKSINNQLNFEIAPFNFDIFYSIHEQMIDIKKLNKLSVSKSELDLLHKCFEQNLNLCIVRDKDNNVLSSCIVILFKDYAYYFLANSNELGRKLSASFYMISKLFQYMSDIKIKEFDFGGITPFNRDAFGVNKFKSGFGGEIVNYIGEKDYTESKILYYLFNLLVWKVR